MHSNRGDDDVTDHVYFDKQFDELAPLNQIPSDRADFPATGFK